MYEVSPVLAAAVPRKPLQPRYMNTTMRSSFNDAYLSSRQRYYPNHGWNRYRTQSHFHYHHHQPSTHNLLPTVFFSPTTFIFALPLLKQTFPPFTLVTNLTASHSPSFSPVLQICVTKQSPGLTGDANLAANSLRFAGSLPPSSFSKPCAVEFQEYKPCMIAPPKPMAWPGSGVACSGL